MSQSSGKPTSLAPPIEDKEPAGVAFVRKRLEEELYGTLYDLGVVAYWDNRAKGFHTPTEKRGRTDYDGIMKRLALSVSELGEAIDAVRDGPWAPSPHMGPGVPHVAEEIADCIIRLCDLAHTHDYNLGSAIASKLKYNRKRPHKHGRAS